MKTVIVGNGLAGTMAAKSLRELDPSLEIEIIAGERYPYYPRPNLIDYVAGALPYEKLFAFPTNWHERQNIAVRLATPVVRIDTAAGTVTTGDGRDFGLRPAPAGQRLRGRGPARQGRGQEVRLRPQDPRRCASHPGSPDDPAARRRPRRGAPRARDRPGPQGPRGGGLGERVLRPAPSAPARPARRRPPQGPGRAAGDRRPAGGVGRRDHGRRGSLGIEVPGRELDRGRYGRFRRGRPAQHRPRQRSGDRGGPRRRRRRPSADEPSGRVRRGGRRSA